MPTASKNKKTSSSKPKSGKSKSKKPLLKRIGVFLAKCLMWFFIVSVSWVVLLRFVPVYYTPLMFIRLTEQAIHGKSMKLDRDWVPISEISNNMPNAVIASEDNLFMQHHGFDLHGIVKAFEHNQRKKKMHGGSTISQQTAKNVFLFPSRTYFRKGLEAYFTVLIEFFWSKERIMEVYLNVIEMGDGIYGVERASQIYFHKPASELSKSQAALIAVCLPNPRKFHPDTPSPYIIKRKSKVLQILPTLKPNLKFPTHEKKE